MPKNNKDGDDIELEEEDHEDDEEESDGPDELPLIRAHDFGKKYATRVLTFPTEFDVRMILSNEVMEGDDGWCMVADEMVILTPIAAKELSSQLRELISYWEGMYGEIPVRPNRRMISSFN